MVEIIPKPTEKKPQWQKILFYISVFIFVGVLVSYFVLISFQKKSDSYLKELEERITKLENKK